MCGIAGILSVDGGGLALRDCVAVIQRALAHRGGRPRVDLFAQTDARCSAPTATAPYSTVVVTRGVNG